MSLSEILFNRGLITEEQAAEAQRHQKAAGGTFFENLVALGYVSREDLERVLRETPKPPGSLEEMDLEPQFLLNLLLKSMYVTGLESGNDIADYVKLSYPVVQSVLEDAKQKHLVEILGMTRDERDFRYSLTDKGRSWALDALQQSTYTGPAPVPLPTFQDQILRQSIKFEQVSDADMQQAIKHLVVPEDARRRLGPAVNSGKSILFYGASGNGKTSVAEAIGDTFHSTVLLPYCVEVSGQIITFFDPAVHREAAGPDQDLDPRWVRCRRPVVITGGELTMEMLDLTYDPVAKYYEAPAHIKAAGGVFIIDDFGRQRVPATELLNRWILPLERGVDYLTLRTGKKLRMPFDQLVVFSTNIPPDQLMDEAAMRRVQYKIHMPAPTRADYDAIFQRVCEIHHLELPTDLLDYLHDTFYPKTGAAVSAYHPRYIVEHVIASCEFEGRPPKLSVELARDALRNMVLVEVPGSG